MRSLAWMLTAAMVGASLGCGGEDPPREPYPVAGESELDLHEDVEPLMEPTYENVALLFRGDPEDDDASGACAYSGCHSGNAGKGGFTFRRSPLDPNQVYRALVEGPTNGVTGPIQACEYRPLRRVEPGDPERSWLYIKLAHEADSRNDIKVQAAEDWDPEESPCSDTFPGSLMPYADGEPVVPLEPEELRMVAEWILDGAPGPVTE